MKILSWNIKEANKHAKRRRVKNMIEEVCPNWIGLSESKLGEVDSHVIGKLTRFCDMGYAYSPSSEMMEDILC